METSVALKNFREVRPESSKQAVSDNRHVIMVEEPLCSRSLEEKYLKESISISMSPPVRG